MDRDKIIEEWKRLGDTAYEARILIAKMLGASVLTQQEKRHLHATIGHFEKFRSTAESRMLNQIGDAAGGINVFYGPREE